MKTQFSGKRPVMFYQPGISEHADLVHGARIRIFYPDGKSEWMSFDALMHSEQDHTLGKGYTFGEAPCWLYRTEIVAGQRVSTRLRPKTIAEAMRLANSFDRAEGWPRMKFLGEL